jgi:hypothetical protein
MTSFLRLFFNATIVVYFVLLTACATSEYVVESDYSYAGTFSKYKSFNFGVNENFGGTEEDKELVEKYIRNVLTAWRYEFEEEKPDIHIFYSFYSDDFAYKGFNQPLLQQWVSKYDPSYGDEMRKSDLGYDSLLLDRKKLSRLSMKEEYNSVTYDLREGTLLIALIDRKKKQTIWQGYASGVMGPDQAKNQRVLRSAIIRILDEFKLLSHSS